MERTMGTEDARTLASPLEADLVPRSIVCNMEGGVVWPDVVTLHPLRLPDGNVGVLFVAG